MKAFPFRLLVGWLLLPTLLGGCGQQDAGHGSENRLAGKDILLLQHDRLPSLEALENEILARPALRKVRVRRHTLPFESGEVLEKSIAEALSKGTPDIIYTQTPVAFTQALKLNTRRIPMVFLTVLSLKDTGVVDDQGRRLPNLEHVTGLAVHAPAHAKHLEALQDAFPGLKRLGILVDEHFNEPALREVLQAFPHLTVEVLRVTGKDPVPAVAERVRAVRVDAWYFPQTTYLQQNIKTLVPLMRQQRVRGMYGWHIASRYGGALSMQASIPDRDKRHAEQMELILSGTPPSQIAIETASTLRVAANSGALSELGRGFNREFIKYVDLFY